MRFDLDTPWGRLRAWLYAMFAEHNFTNVIRFNFHRISDEAYRSSQPTMWQLRRKVRKHGIKTLINLKGCKPGSAYYQLEREQCARLGIHMIDVAIDSRNVPNAKVVRRAKEILETVEYPIWMHCKAGADRAGIFSTLYQHFRQGIPIAKTNQLRFWPYGHLRQSKAGKADHFFECFTAFEKANPGVDFLTWSQAHADYAQITREFKPGGLADFINDKILRRE